MNDVSPPTVGRAWKSPGWPWELEILTLLFVVLAISCPYFVYTNGGAPSTPASLLAQAGVQSRSQGVELIQEQYSIMWSIGIAAAYLVYLFTTIGSNKYLSTPIQCLLAPMLFAGVAYYRSLMAAKDMGQTLPWANGTASQIILYGLTVVVLVLIAARIRLARFMFSFRNDRWDVTTPSHLDGTFSELAAQFHPLVYTPRMYRAASSGVLIEGWFYAMALPFDTIHSLTSVAHASMATSGLFLATSAKSLIRMELLDSAVPIFISPQDRDDFLNYCAQHVLRHRPATKHGTHHGGTARPTHG